MRQDSRLSRVLHALLHLHGMEAPATSDLLASMLGTNASVVRRTMAGLRSAGIVAATKGHGGGWSLARPLDRISLLEIYQALGSPELFAIGNDEDEPTCLLARAANAATNRALTEARQQFELSLKAVSVADLTADWRPEMARH
ncbi:Rrf2 family transcriptional regulator [Devosia neptuniae]|jgi:Rrf2 family protein|uniref:Rrf2 family transcriptional regulator n=1 Tax=Devosia neptuniae TaxID=191302 RepID=A0ABY6CJU1_9HYPH|nr:Rrf2 family transcriptional regulator [Devosia neptuniae]UXN70288.1 Rrf2 family transcriptional regulator [Devosia neptuniae]